MGYIMYKHNSHLVFDPTYPLINMDTFKTGKEQKEFYWRAEEAIPPNALAPCGKEIDLRMFVDSNHAGDSTNRQSCTGFMIFIQNSLICWLSKKQATI